MSETTLARLVCEEATAKGLANGLSERFDEVAAAAFEGWAAARGASRGGALTDAWSKFAKARPFWSHG